MLRLRSTILLAGASALALISGFAAAHPARATDNFTGPLSLGGDSVLFAGDIPAPRALAPIGGLDLNLGGVLSQITQLLDPPPVAVPLDHFPFVDGIQFTGLTSNERAVGDALANIFALGSGEGGNLPPDFKALFDYLSNLGPGDEGIVRGIFNELAGSELVQLQHTTLALVTPFSTLIGQRLDAAKFGMSGGAFAEVNRQRQQYAQSTMVMSDAASGITQPGSGVSIWARGYGQWANLHGDANAPGYDQNTGGFAGGVDVAIGSNAILGLAGGWSSTDVDFNTPGDKASIDSWQIGGYGSYGFGRFYIDAQLVGAFHDLSTTRVLNLPTPPGGMVAGANYDARSLLASAEFGGVWTYDNWMFQPHAALLYTDVSTDAFIESGGGDFNLIAKKSHADSFASSLGLRVATQFKAGNTILTPEFSAAWRHDFDDGRQTFTAAFPADPASTFRIVSSKISPDSAIVAAGITAGLSKNLDLFLNYSGLLNPDVNVHNVSVGLRVTW